jgi:protein-tyrosine phosphatase
MGEGRPETREHESGLRMPEVLDWRTVPDPRSVIHYAARLLHAGQVVAFPTETTYTLAASALVPGAVERLAGEPPLTLAVRGAAEARDWAPAMGTLGQRLARRFWPGPLTLESSEGVAEGLAARLEAAVRQRVCPGGAVRLRAPAHEAILAVLAELPGPLLLASAPGGGPSGPGAVTAEQVLGESNGHVDLLLDDGPSRLQQAPTLVRVAGASWHIVQPGVVSDDLLRQQSACLVVFVCTGNTCRSPLAEALCKKRLADELGCTVEELPARGFQVKSAGVSAFAGGAAAPEAIEVARTFGADLAAHQSRPLTPELAAGADYLVAMTHGHLLTLTDLFPRLGSRPRLLSPEGADLPDPIGLGADVYAECGRQIWSHLGPLLEEIRR